MKMLSLQQSGLASRPRSRKVHFLIFVTSLTLYSCFVTATHRVKHNTLHSPAYISDISDRAFFPEQDLSGTQLSRRDSPGQTGGGTSSSTSDDYTCGPSKPCGNKACCGKSGWCGYNATYCGDGCQSNCDAKAECGVNAATPGKTCPLNVCCSEYGFCGTTSDFCSAGCQSNCKQPKPSVSAGDVQKKIIAYYEGWNTQHSCGTMQPDEIPVRKITHLIAAFGYITPSTYTITNMDGVSPNLYKDLTSLKSKNADLKVMIALGGWSFTDPGPWQSVFPSLVSTKASRARFITNLIGFLSQYGFDGVDFDWEYPGADDRGGSANDGVNYTSLLKELQAAIKASGHQYIVTFTTPTSYWYLRHFDLANMYKYADWINLMSYDLHGVWDSNNPIGSQVLAHTNLTEIDLALDLYWRNSVPPDKIVMGLGFYGRSFQLKDAGCWKPGCAFAGAGAQGPCTATAGILSYKEITDIISKTGAKPFYDKESAVNYLVYEGDNWISYDDKTSFQAKIDYANKLGLNGIMIWAIDQDNTNHDALNAVSPLSGDDLLQFEEDSGASIAHSSGDLSQCKVQDGCGVQCDHGWTAMTRVGTQPGVKKNCGTDNFHYVCCPSYAAPDPSTCYWNLDRADGGLKGDCNGGCKNVGDIKVAGDSWGWVGDVFNGHSGDKCKRGGVTYCCPAGNLAQYLKICTWTDCNKDCPSDKPVIKTTDVGGSSSQNPSYTCYADSTVDSLDRETYYYDYEQRKLCCPSDDSLKNCDWHSKKECSEPCPDNQIEIDSDAGGKDGKNWCSWGRTQKYCCDPPGGTNKPFLPADLNTLFPPEYLPSPDSIPEFDLVSFNGLYSAGEIEDPNASGVAFVLFAGSDTAVSKMKKREDRATGIEFIDCAADIRSAPSAERRSTRVICLGEEPTDCFPVRKGGVEGTLVSMPRGCGGGFARAVSLQFARNQSLPDSLISKNPTSAIFDFVFDYNMDLIRRDSGPLSMRVDYSNVGGYWAAVVKAPGIVHKRGLEDRYFDSSSSGWASTFANLKEPPGDAKHVVKNLNDLVYYQYGASCPIDSDTTAPEGLAISAKGSVALQIWYGFSMVATIEGGAVKVHEANGFVKVNGQTDMTFEISGMGIFDASSGGTVTQPLVSPLSAESLGGHSILDDFISFDPFFKSGYNLGSTNSILTQSDDDSSVAWNGYANARMVTHFGSGISTFPTQTKFDSDDDTFETGKVFTNSLDGAYVTGGDIGVSHIVEVGLKVSMKVNEHVTQKSTMPTIAMHSETQAVFLIDNSTVAGKACLDVHMGKEQYSKWTDGSDVGWDAKGAHTLAAYSNRVGTPSCFATDSGTTKRAPCSGATCRGPFALFPAINYLAGQGAQTSEAIFNAIKQSDMTLAAAQIIEDSSWYCEDQNDDAKKCCGCADMDLIYGPDNAYTDADFETDPGLISPTSPISRRQKFVNPYTHELTDDYEHLNATEEFQEESETYHKLDDRANRTPGGIGYGPKKVTICNSPKVNGPNYPSYPKPSRGIDWATTDNGQFSGVLYYDRSSESCSDWDTQQVASPRIMTGTTTAAAYDTEHVFEGQAIGDFFNEYIWLGRLSWFVDKRKVVTGDDFWDCAWTMVHVRRRSALDTTWDANGKEYSFADRILQEMGSMTNLDRLVIFPQRPNIDKGALFGGTMPYSPASYRGKGPQDQLLIMKEMAMAFTYMNLAPIVSAFCRTYEGIYTLMGQFDTWYTGRNPNDPNPNFQVRWQEYVRDLLDNVVLFGHQTALFWFATMDWANMDQFYLDIWHEVTAHEAGKMHLLQVFCPNLPATTLANTNFLSSPR